MSCMARLYCIHFYSTALKIIVMISSHDEQPDAAQPAVTDMACALQ